MIQAPPRTAKPPDPFDVVQRMPVALFWFAVVHVPLAILMQANSTVATMHALVTVGVGLLWATTAKEPKSVAYFLAYVMGTEVLWRMTDAHIFWEVGKLLAIVCVLIVLARSRMPGRSALPVLFFLLLLPSTVLTVLGAATAEPLRNMLSFNLGGPLALALCAWLFSGIRFNGSELRRLIVVSITPITGVLILAVLGSNAPGVVYGFESNVASSGGFGPNQVSSVLGLAAFLAFILLVLFRGTGIFRALVFLLMVAFAAQSALTFSRSGLLVALVAAFTTSILMLRRLRGGLRVAIVGGLILAIGSLVVIPRLQSLTSGRLIDRFTTSDSTGRDLIARADLRIFSEHVLLGVGPGRAPFLRSHLSRRTAAHSEFTRLLAEHGLFGLMALIVLLVIAGRAIARAAPGRSRAFAVGCLFWALTFMFINAMRILGPSLMFAFAYTTGITNDLSDEAASPARRVAPSSPSRGLLSPLPKVSF